MGKRYTAEVRAEVLDKVGSGRKVSEVAREHGINPMTIRTWLERDAEGNRGMTLENGRLKRENNALREIIGQLVYDADREKKNQGRPRG